MDSYPRGMKTTSKILSLTLCRVLLIRLVILNCLPHLKCLGLSIIILKCLLLLICWHLMLESEFFVRKLIQPQHWKDFSEEGQEGKMKEKTKTREIVPFKTLGSLKLPSSVTILWFCNYFLEPCNHENMTNHTGCLTMPLYQESWTGDH